MHSGHTSTEEEWGHSGSRGTVPHSGVCLDLQGHHRHHRHTGAQAPQATQEGGAPWGHPETPNGPTGGTHTQAHRGTGTDTQSQRHTSHRDTQPQRRRDTGTQGHRDTGTQRHRDTETQRHRDRHRQWEGGLGGHHLCVMLTWMTASDLGYHLL